jgi:ABC-2 type transport system permease protein
VTASVLPIIGKPTGLGASLTRTGALVRRYFYLIKSSWVRSLEIVYWPFLQMLMWGFLQKYLAGNTGSALTMAGGYLIGAVLLWDIQFRSQIGFSIGFLEEMWSRNLGHLLTSPLRPNELIAALSVMSLMRLAIAMVPVTFSAYLFFGFNLFGLGLGLAAFFAILVMTGWALALLSSGIILRYGLAAEELSWSLGFILLPLACVYYPVAVLPVWLQPIAQALPSTHVFEGMRGILLHNTFSTKEMWWALGLNALYLLVAYATFRVLLRAARVNGSLLQLGE